VINLSLNIDEEKNKENEKKINSEKFNTFPEAINEIDSILNQILNIFNNINIIEPQELEILYINQVGKFSKMIKLLLNIYFENNREIQLKYKPEILYYRQVQAYLVFILRYSEILRVRDHEEIQQTKSFILNKEKLMKEIYNELAEQETYLFESDFRDKLDEKIRRMINYKNK